MQTLYADVIVDITADALDRPFSYIVPEAMRENVVAGSQVMVPFGNRLVRGYVIGFHDSCDYDPAKMKEISSVMTGEDTAEAENSAVNYAEKENWVYYGVGDDKDVDLFLVCPSVDTLDEENMSLENEVMKKFFEGEEMQNRVELYMEQAAAADQAA
jgi:primosomal protein N'